MERQKLLSEVKQEWTRKETLYRQKQHEKNQHYKQYESDNQPDKERDTDTESNNSIDDFDSETDRDLRECTLKGRNMALSQFFRIARNTMSVWFKNGAPEPSEVSWLIDNTLIACRHHPIRTSWYGSRKCHICFSTPNFLV